MAPYVHHHPAKNIHRSFDIQWWSCNFPTGFHYNGFHHVLYFRHRPCLCFQQAHGGILGPVHKSIMSTCPVFEALHLVVCSSHHSTCHSNVNLAISNSGFTTMVTARVDNIDHPPKPQHLPLFVIVILLSTALAQQYSPLTILSLSLSSRASP